MNSFFQFDNQYRQGGIQYLCGVDEAGRGPLAGPVVTAAVILPEEAIITGINDSKKLTPAKREKLYDEIYEKAVSVGVGIVHEREIDRMNILKATILAMKKSLGALSVKPQLVLIDGNPVEITHFPVRNLVKGDTRSLSIAAASVIAKVTRDRMMSEYGKIFPDFGFERHKGYGTSKHIDVLKKLGATPIHRRSFSPVSSCLPGKSHFENRQWLGKYGEQLAACAMVKLGFRILQMNYLAAGVGEIDLIHEEGDEWVFSEVKTGFAKNDWGDPAHRIDEYKRDRLMEAAADYLSKNDFTGHTRFDVISVQFFKGKPRITRIKGGLSID